MPNPNGAIQAISSAAATTLAVGVAFLGFWGYGAASGKIAWECKHLWVLFPAVLSYCSLAAVPFWVTRAKDEEKEICRGRNLYVAGVTLLLIAMIIAILQSES